MNLSSQDTNGVIPYLLYLTSRLKGKRPKGQIRQLNTYDLLRKVIIHKGKKKDTKTLISSYIVRLSKVEQKNPIFHSV